MALDSDLDKLEMHSEEGSKLLRSGKEAALIRKVEIEIEKQRQKLAEAVERSGAEHLALNNRLRKEQQRNREVLKNLQDSEDSQMGYSDLKKMKEDLDLKISSISNEISSMNLKIKALENENAGLELDLCKGGNDYIDSMNLLLYSGLGLDLCEDEHSNGYTSCRIYNEGHRGVEVELVDLNESTGKHSYELCNNLWELCSKDVTIMHE